MSTTVQTPSAHCTYTGILLRVTLADTSSWLVTQQSLEERRRQGAKRASGALNTKAGRVCPVRHPTLCTQQSFADIRAASVAVDLVLLAAKPHWASHNASGHRVVVLGTAGARAGETLTYVGVVGGGIGCLASLSATCIASTARLLMVELQVLQALCQGQLLLNSHAQQRVEGLLLILCCSQLPLHLIQLGDIFITTARHTENNC